MRALLILLWTCGIAIASYFHAGTTTARRPTPEIDQAATPGQYPLPSSSVFDPTLQVSDPPCLDVCSGTAFAVDDQGHWLTANHVVRNCRQVAIMTGPGRAVRATELVSHPRADVTLISGPTAPALSLGWGTLFRGQDGFHFGYPRGQPGDVHGELMGRIKVRGSRVLEPGILWAEIEREPSNDLPLGGLSGGPVLGPGGDVIGLAIAASPRRGRVTSAAPESLHDVMAQAGLRLADTAPPARPPVVNVAASNYAAFGDQLRQRMSVARILCWDRDAASRRPGLR